MSDPLRFFVPQGSLQEERVVVDGEPCHHMRNVLRLRPGTVALLLDGAGLCCEVQLEQLQAEKVTARVLRRWQVEETALPVTLMQALPKGDKLDLVLQKGTELGVRGFQPLESDHSVPSPAGPRLVKREQRWQRIVAEAARQSRRSLLPEVKPLQKLVDAIAESSADLNLVLWEAGSLPLAEALPEEPPAGVRVLIGPEGGFSATEIEVITAAGFRSVHLGPRIMRTETAGLAVVAVLQYLYGDWQKTPAGSDPGV